MAKEINGTVQSSKHGRMAVVTCFFNWAGFHRKTANLRRFLHQMAAQDIPVFGIEAVLPGQEPVTKGFDGWQRVPATERNIMFQKEALLNKAVSLVPAEFTKIAWFDADVWSANYGWFKTAEIMLDSYPVVQLYGSARWLDQSGNVEIERDGIAKWNAHGRKGTLSMAHTGFAWAAQRKLWTEFGGLYDNCITGSGDIYNSLAFAGLEPESHPMLSTDRQKVSGDFKKWAWRIREWTQSSIGYVPGIIYHEWHGTRKDRSYVKRHEVCAQISVKGDIITNEFGLKEWTDAAKPEAISAVRQYFIDRREDGSEPQQTSHLPSAMLVDQSGASVVVTTHPAYIEFLDRTLAAIDAQKLPFAQKILVLDGFDTPPFESRAGWTIVRSSARNPNASRNLGLAEVVNEWVIFWDGDNTMPEDYHLRMIEARVMSSPKTAFLYPNVRYIDTAGIAKKLIQMPEYDYWLLRERAFVDTSSIWRVDALRGVGGFNLKQPRLDDYSLALKLTRAGWAGMRSGVETHITHHPDRRSANNDLVEAMWQAYTFGILTLWSGINKATQAVMNWFRTAELPPRSRLYWMCSDDPVLRSALDDVAMELSANARVESITIMDAGAAWVPTEKGSRDFGRHLHVANLYNRIVPSIQDDMLMLIEDDNIGPTNGIRQLLSSFKQGDSLACSAGLYRSRSNPGCSCASSARDKWITVQYDEAIGKQTPVYMVGGGFALYGNWAIRKAVPFRSTNPNGGIIGWDAHLGMSLHENGYKIMLRGDVPVQHLCEEVVQFLERREQKLQRAIKVMDSVRHKTRGLRGRVNEINAGVCVVHWYDLIGPDDKVNMKDLELFQLEKETA